MSKPAVGSVVIAQRDIIRPMMDTIAEGTSLIVTDDMDRDGYRKPRRIGVRVPNTAGMSIGVDIGTDVFVCSLSHEHYIGTDTTGDGLDCYPMSRPA